MLYETMARRMLSTGQFKRGHSFEVNGTQTIGEITVKMGDDSIDYNIVFSEALTSGK